MIVDASSINSIDITAADRLEAIASSMKKKGISSTSRNILPI